MLSQQTVCPMWSPALFGHLAPLGGRTLNSPALYSSYVCVSPALDCEPLACLLALYWVPPTSPNCGIELIEVCATSGIWNKCWKVLSQRAGRSQLG